MSSVRIGVLRMVLSISGARTLKDRRQVVRSLRDRVRHRFAVTWNEVDAKNTPTRCTVVCTTAGDDARLLRSMLDRVQAFVEQSGSAWPISVDSEVFQWHPSDVTWQVEESSDG